MRPVLPYGSTLSPAGNLDSSHERPLRSESRAATMPPSLRPEHLLVTILSSTEDGLLSFSLDGVIQSWSRGAERLYGYSEAEITGQSIKMLLPSCEIPACEEFLRVAKDGISDCRKNAERLRKDPAQMRVTLKRAR